MFILLQSSLFVWILLLQLWIRLSCRCFSDFSCRWEFSYLLCVCFYPILGSDGFRCFYRFGVFGTRAQYRASLCRLVLLLVWFTFFWKDAIRINDEFFVLIADGLRRFSRPSLMITVVKKDKAEGSWLKSDRKRCSEINGILKRTNKRQSRIDSSKFPSLEKVHQLPSWSCFMKYS